MCLCVFLRSQHNLVWVFCLFYKAQTLPEEKGPAHHEHLEYSVSVSSIIPTDSLTNVHLFAFQNSDSTVDPHFHLMQLLSKNYPRILPIN